ncbi:hypothetical protein [Sphingobacterium pedocola]|nr:hypothetical protein [Sphingobacterium pedocola]
MNILRCSILLLMGLLAAGKSAVAQLTFAVYSQNYTEVTSYLGRETGDYFNNMHIQYQGTSINFPQWSVSVRLLSPIVPRYATNVSGKSFPVEKISFRFTQDDNQQLTLANTGATRNYVILPPANEAMLIKHAKEPIFLQEANNTHRQSTLSFSMKIEGGKYLDQYKNTDIYSPIQYGIPVLYTLYDRNGNVLGAHRVDYTLQIGNNLTDGNLIDVEPNYSLSIGAEASNASLVFNTLRDYEEGVTATYQDAVKVNALTGYELQVKALGNELTSEHGDPLNLAILTVSLSPGSKTKIVRSLPSVKLSNIDQVVLEGDGAGDKSAQFFNLNYRAKFTREQLKQVKSGAYHISLRYLLMPK